MQNRSAAPAVFFVAAIAFFAAGGTMLRQGSAVGSAFFGLGGAMIAIGSGLAARRRKRAG